VSLPHEAFSDPHEAVSLPHETFSDPHEAVSGFARNLQSARKVRVLPAKSQKLGDE
jgi:hypothetical protein